MLPWIDFRFRGLPYILFIFFQAELLCHDEQFSKFLCCGCSLSIQIYCNSYTALSRCHPLEPEVASPRKISVPETRMQTPAFFLVIDSFYRTKSRFQEYFKPVPVSALFIVGEPERRYWVPFSLEFPQWTELRRALSPANSCPVIG
jgi:hypothetical protein